MSAGTWAGGAAQLQLSFFPVSSALFGSSSVFDVPGCGLSGSGNYLFICQIHHRHVHIYETIFTIRVCVNRSSRPEGLSGYGYRGYSSLLWLSSPVHFISRITLYRPGEQETFEGEVRIHNDT